MLGISCGSTGWGGVGKLARSVRICCQHGARDGGSASSATRNAVRVCILSGARKGSIVAYGIQLDQNRYNPREDCSRRLAMPSFWFPGWTFGGSLFGSHEQGCCQYGVGPVISGHGTKYVGSRHMRRGINCPPSTECVTTRKELSSYYTRTAFIVRGMASWADVVAESPA